MQTGRSGNRVVIDNLMWFAGSMLLAFLVWVIATLQSDPVRERVFNVIPIQIEPDRGLVITEQSRDSVAVVVRAPQSTLDQLNVDDIQVLASLAGLGEGSHRINLEPHISRRASADTSPRQISVTLEEAREQYVPIVADLVAQPPQGYEIADDGISFNVNQTLIGGPVSKVVQVTAARAVLNLSSERAPVENDYRLVPVDVSGELVEGLTLDPATVRATIPIQPRSDVREVRVTPNILADTLPEGYALTEITYAPEIILVGSTPDRLANVPGTFFTAPIDLSGRTMDFEQDVAVQLPDNNLLLIGNQTIRVSVGITPLVASRQFDRVPVDMIGLSSGLDAVITPSEVTILIIGPQRMVETLAQEELQVVIDLNGLGEGSYQLEPQITFTQGQMTDASLSVLPSLLDVVITSLPVETETPAGS